MSGPCFHLAQPRRTAEKPAHLISMSLLSRPILTPLQNHQKPHQVLSQREDGNHGSSEVLRKAMKTKEQRVGSGTSSSELAREPLSSALSNPPPSPMPLLQPRGWRYLFCNDSENKHNSFIHSKYLCPVPELSPFQNPGLLLLWQRDSPGDSDTSIPKHFC